MQLYFKRLLLPVSMCFIFITTNAQKPSILPEVLVVARPLIEATKLDSFAAVSAVISQAQIRDLNAVDIASALRRTPGVQISRFNPVGSFGGGEGGAVFIRGMGVSRPGSEIKTYIEGLPFYMGLWNHPLLDLLPVNGMQSIQVYKSPQPQVNGNNFASINLQTLNAVADSVQMQGSVRISAGSFGTFIQQVNWAGKSGKVDYGIAQGFARSNGHRVNAKGELKNLMANVGVDLHTNWRAEVRFIYTNNLASDPGDARSVLPATAPQYNTEAGMLSAGILHQFKNVVGELRLYSNRGNGSWLNQPAPDGNTISRFTMSGLRWKEQVTPWKLAAITTGIDYDHLGGSADFNRVNPAPQTKFVAPGFSIFSPYAALNQQLLLGRGWILQPSIGARYYSHNNFKSAVAPHVGLILSSPRFTLFGNASKGINYPGLETVLLSSLIAPLGNSWQQLKPEELSHVELGLKWLPTPATQFDISVFQDKVKNRYVFGFPPNVPPPPQFINLGNYRMQGAEISLRQCFHKAWQLFTGITLLDPDISNLPYTPKTAVTAGINGRVGRVSIVLDGQYQSAVWALNKSRTAGDINSERVEGFTVINTRIAYQLPVLGKQGEIFTSVENLLNTTYGYRPGYIMPGRWIQFGISASFSKLRSK